MASLDVEGLFSNLPLDETIENCIDDLFSNNDTVHNFIKEDLKELLKFVSNESFFTFDNECYYQLDVVAMRFLLGRTLSNAFLFHFEKQGLSYFPEDLFRNIYRRYVDVFATFNSDKQVCRINEHKTSRYQI